MKVCCEIKVEIFTKIKSHEGIQENVCENSLKSPISPDPLPPLALLLSLSRSLIRHKIAIGEKQKTKKKKSINGENHIAKALIWSFLFPFIDLFFTPIEIEVCTKMEIHQQQNDEGVRESEQEPVSE